MSRGTQSLCSIFSLAVCVQSFDTSAGAELQFIAITKFPAYSRKSFEELRLEDMVKGTFNVTQCTHERYTVLVRCAFDVLTRHTPGLFCLMSSPQRRFHHYHQLLTRAAMSVLHCETAFCSTPPGRHLHSSRRVRVVFAAAFQLSISQS